VFRRRCFTTRAEPQQTLDAVMRYDKTQRPHRGYRVWVESGRPRLRRGGIVMSFTTLGRQKRQHHDESGPRSREQSAAMPTRRQRACQARAFVFFVADRSEGAFGDTDRVGHQRKGNILRR